MLAGTAWYGFRDLSPANYFSTAAALGLTFVEIPLYWHVVDDELFNVRNPQALVALAEQTGVQMHAGVAAIELARPFDIRGLPITETSITFHKALARQVIDTGAVLGLEVIRIVEPNVDPGNLDLIEQYMNDYGLALRELGEYAETKGLQIVAENYGVNAEHMRMLLDAADHPNVGTLFDPCNYFRMGDDPVAALELMGNKVFYCHLKDTVNDDPRSEDELFPGSRWRPSVGVGRGDIDWLALLPALASVYSGVAVIECEMPDDVVAATTRSRDFLVAELGASYTLGRGA